MATIREISDRAGCIHRQRSPRFLNNKSGVKQGDGRPNSADRGPAQLSSESQRPLAEALGDARTIGIITEDLTVFNTPGDRRRRRLRYAKR